MKKISNKQFKIFLILFLLFIFLLSAQMLGFLSGPFDMFVFFIITIAPLLFLFFNISFDKEFYKSFWFFGFFVYFVMLIFLYVAVF